MCLPDLFFGGDRRNCKCKPFPSGKSTSNLRLSFLYGNDQLRQIDGIIDRGGQQWAAPEVRAFVPDTRNDGGC